MNGHKYSPAKGSQASILVDAPDEWSLQQIERILPRTIKVQAIELATRIQPRTYLMWQPSVFTRAMKPSLLLLIVQHQDSDWEICRRSAADFASVTLGIALKIIDLEETSPEPVALEVMAVVDQMTNAIGIRAA
jgi:hypothetical protein